MVSVRVVLQQLEGQDKMGPIVHHEIKRGELVVNQPNLL